MISRFVEISISNSIVALFHKGTGRLLVFTSEILPLLNELQSCKDKSTFEDAMYQETMDILKKFDMLDM